jgi:hypothetical protein
MVVPQSEVAYGIRITSKLIAGTEATAAANSKNGNFILKWSSSYPITKP